MQGAFVLGTPGTYVAERPDALIIGNRPGLLHFSIAFGVPPVVLGIGWLFRDEPWIGLLALTLFGIPAVLVAVNTQRYEVRSGVVQMRGRALGLPVLRDWPLPAASAVRVASTEERDGETGTLWTVYQAQILTDGGWIALAESGDVAAVSDFAGRLAAAAGVPIQGA